MAWIKFKFYDQDLFYITEEIKLSPNSKKVPATFFKFLMNNIKLIHVDD